MAPNPFATEVAARLYAAGRLDYSKHVSDIIRRRIAITDPVDCAVDVGSGTGISTMALSPLARTVIGVEPSPAMLDRARRAGNVTYRLGSAEELPVEDGCSDLIAVGSAIHWFDRLRFLDEASRIAKPHAWLVVHDHWFVGEIEEDQDFARWVREIYLDRYPPPSRNRSWRPPDDLGEWRHVVWERYDHRVAFDADGLTDYLLTQSNLQTAIEHGDDTVDGLREWLKSQTGRYFANARTRMFRFGGFVACHRRASP